MNKILTVRHMDDVNALREHGFNGPLQKGQEELLTSIVSGIETEIKNETTVRILYTSKTRRIKETALGIAECLGKKYSVIMEDDLRLESIDRGELILPEIYQDGDWFSPLDDAWEYANDEMFLYKNIFYRFGDHFHGKYPKLSESFSKPGNSFGESLVKKFSLICDLINRKEAAELVVIVGQSDLPLLLLELMVLANELEGVTAQNLPYVYWDRYKSNLPRETAYDREGIEFGQVEIFDLSTIIETGMAKIIQKSYLLLCEQSECIQVGVKIKTGKER